MDKFSQPLSGADAFNAEAEGEAIKNQLSFSDYLVDMTRPMRRPDYMLECDGVSMLPKGSIATITGAAKNGKTSWLAAIVACLVSGRSFGTMRRREAPGHILWLDTEQSDFNIQQTMHRVYKQAGIPEGTDAAKLNMSILKLRPLAPEQRFEVFMQAVEHLRPQVIIIDGFRDMVTSINDEQQSTEFITRLLQITDEMPETLILGVIHTNYGQDKMRGWLGTELENKMQDKFTCTKENGVFHVKHASRDREMQQPFIFCIDGNGELATATVEQGAGVVDTDAALRKSVPDEGCDFTTLVKNYRKNTGLSDKKARDALKAHINAGEIRKIASGIFVLNFS